METKPYPEMLDDLEGAKRVFIGESHDNRRHHEAQLELIRDPREGWKDPHDRIEHRPADRRTGGEGGVRRIPERVRRIADHPVRVILPSGGAGPFGFDLTKEDTDYVWWMDA